MRSEAWILVAVMLLSAGCATGDCVIKRIVLRDAGAETQPARDENASGAADASADTDARGGGDDADIGAAPDASADAEPTDPPIGDYVFDAIPRKVTKADAECPEVEIVEYDGTHLSLNQELEIDRRFVPKVRRLEKLAVEVAEEVYGREPTRLVHRGGYRCRSVKGRKKRWSEHAFGNAIDVVGFDFGDGADEEAFEVRVADHWRSKKKADARHARFLHTLVRRILDEHAFRIVLGPGDPTHEEILHFDYAPQWYVVIDFPGEE